MPVKGKSSFGTAFQPGQNPTSVEKFATLPSPPRSPTTRLLHAPHHEHQPRFPSLTRPFLKRADSSTALL